MKLSKECFDNKKIVICNKIYNCHIVKDLASNTDNNGEIEYRTENINIDEKLLNQPLRLYDKVGTINNIVNQALEENE